MGLRQSRNLERMNASAPRSILCSQEKVPIRQDRVHINVGFWSGILRTAQTCGSNSQSDERRRSAQTTSRPRRDDLRPGWARTC
jgi:hypothetical protein